MRIAAAPISWGVCEVPGWGYQMGPDRVLSEMASLGIGATEAGPEGFLPDDPRQLSRALDEHGLSLVGGFVPIVLHEPDSGGLDRLRTAADRVATAGGEVVVLAAASGQAGYDERPGLDDTQWKTLLTTLDRSIAVCADAGVRVAFHPHAGTIVETPEEISRVLDGSEVPLCLDTGHVMVGGGDPVALARDAGDRISHVHLKDVDSGVIGRVRGGELPFAAAVRHGMFKPLGDGDLETETLLGRLTDIGYTGWLVLEQDVAFDNEPESGSGPIHDVDRSVTHLRSIMASSSR